MLLAHRRRQPPLELAEQLAEAAVRVALRMDRPILVPQHQQIDARALELAHQRRPVGLGMQAEARTHPGVDKQSRDQLFVGHVRGEWPADPGRSRAAQILAHRARRDAQFPPDRPAARAGTKMHRQQLLDPPHGQPLCRHPTPPSIAMAALEARSLLTCETILSPDALSLRRSGRHRQNGGRLEIGTVGGISSERRAASDRNRWAAYVGIRTYRRFPSPRQCLGQ